jgi:hypothetical protein
MKLKHQEHIDLIENCPLENQKGEKILYRCVENPMSPRSFDPYAVMNKPKLKENCLAWGLSMFTDLKSAKQILNNLSQKKKDSINIQGIASGKVTDNDGVKHSSKNSKHYTFYPKNDIDLISKFVIVSDNEK